MLPSMVKRSPRDRGGGGGCKGEEQGLRFSVSAPAAAEAVEEDEDWESSRGGAGRLASGAEEEEEEQAEGGARWLHSSSR